MAYCKHCGGEVQDGAVICPHCQKRLVGGSAGKSALIAGGIACGCLGLIALLGRADGYFVRWPQGTGR